MPEIATEKAAQRAAIRAKLAAEVPQGEATQKAALAARDNFLRAWALPPGLIVAGTLPIRQELDTRPLLSALAQKGHPLCLPVTGALGTPLAFRAFRFGDLLQRSGFGIEEPLAEQPPLVPDVLICPLLAFDAQGHRLGQGGGYYDATLRALRAMRKNTFAVGFAWSLQEVPAVPVAGGDEKLDAIVTERGVLDFSARSRRA